MTIHDRITGRLHREGQTAKRTERSDADVVAQTNALARTFYALAFGHSVPEGHGFHEFDRSNYHPQERMCWEMACAAQTELTSTDPADALANLEDQ